MASPTNRRLLRAFVFFLALGFAMLGLWESFARGDLTRYAALGDLYPRWYGARETLLHGRNPYSPEVSAEIQVAYYGHQLANGEGKDEQRFAYPAYAVFYLWPTIGVPFDQVRYLVALALLALIIIMTIGWVRSLYGPASWKASLLATLLVAGSVPAIQAVKIQQLAALVIALMSFGIFAATRKKFLLSGMLFALATVKPQLVFIPLAWMLLWSLSDWKSRKPFVFGFAASLAALVALGEAVVPGWPRFFLEGLFAYRNYTDSSGVLVVLFGKSVGYTLACILLLTVAAYAWRTRRLESSTPGFLLTCALVFCAMNACQPWLAAPFNQLLLVPATLLVLREQTIVRYAVGFALLIPAGFAVLSRMAPLSAYLSVPVSIQLAFPLCILLAVLREVWRRAPKLERDERLTSAWPPRHAPERVRADTSKAA